MPPPVLHALFPSRALALPARGRAVPPLGGPLAPSFDVTAGPMPSTSHPSTPYDVGQDRQPDRPKHDEANHHEGDPSRPAEVIYACHDIRHGGFTSGDVRMSKFLKFTLETASGLLKGPRRGIFPGGFGGAGPRGWAAD